MLIFIPFATYEKTGFPELAGRSFTDGFSGPKSVPDFRETGPWYCPLSMTNEHEKQINEISKKGKSHQATKSLKRI